MPQFESLRHDAEAAIEAAADTSELERLRVAYLGRKGQVTAALRNLKDLPSDQRPAAGAEIQAVRAHIEQALAARGEELAEAETQVQVEAERLDVTLSGRRLPPGARHPTTCTLQRICAWFARYGYGVTYGPEIEDDYHNFEALNIPPLHPARAMHDTFYFGDGRLLRTHTSPVQVRTMSRSKPPIRMLAPGRVYRCDSDPTHSPMFHQVEGLCVETDLSMADLKGVLTAFLKDFFEDHEIETRFRASYFPFTEPSAEVDVRRAGGDWLEVMGCGMVHPAVLEEGGIDPEHHTGFAFGMGVERLAMLYYGISDLRVMFANDLRFLEQFGGSAS